MKWYVINVFNSKETKVKEDIDKVIEIDNHSKFVKQVLVPKEKYFQIRKSKKIKAERNYFPGYVFIECDMNGELQRSIQSVKGVISFLKGANGPVYMSEREVKNMLSKVEEIQITDEIEIDKMYKIGQSVTVIDGPFASFHGDITEINNSKKTIRVEVSIFSRKTPVDLRVDQITID